MCRTGVKKMGHPTVAKVPSAASEEDPSRKRKGDEVAASAEGSKKAKGDDNVAVSDDAAAAPAGLAVEATASTKEGVSLPRPEEATSFGAGASIATSIEGGSLSVSSRACRAFSISLRVWQSAVVCVAGFPSLLWNAHGWLRRAAGSNLGLFL